MRDVALLHGLFLLRSISLRKNKLASLKHIFSLSSLRSETISFRFAVFLPPVKRGAGILIHEVKRFRMFFTDS
jgi:hypothetical protein